MGFVNTARRRDHQSRPRVHDAQAFFCYTAITPSSPPPSLIAGAAVPGLVERVIPAPARTDLDHHGMIGLPPLSRVARSSGRATTAFPQIFPDAGRRGSTSCFTLLIPMRPRPHLARFRFTRPAAMRATATDQAAFSMGSTSARCSPVLSLRRCGRAWRRDRTMGISLNRGDRTRSSRRHPGVGQHRRALAGVHAIRKPAGVPGPAYREGDWEVAPCARRHPDDLPYGRLGP
jgi:hypothetical protein